MLEQLIYEQYEIPSTALGVERNYQKEVLRNEFDTL